MSRHPAIPILFYFRFWINNKRPTEPAHHKLESMAKKEDYLYEHDLEVLQKILEEEKIDET